MNYSYNYIEQKAEDILIENDFFKAGFDVKKLSKKLKIDVIGKKLDHDVSGLFVRINDKPVISYNSNEKNKARERFTIAHELGHYFLHSKGKLLFIDKTPKVMFRNSASSSGEQLQEREANHFAAALLMPKKLIKEEINNAPEDIDNPIEYLAKIFKVSEQAVTFRLANLGYDIGLY